MPLPRPPVATLAAGTVGGAGTEVALRAVLADRPAHGSTAIVPPAFAADAEGAGWRALAGSRAVALLRELVGAPRSDVWIGFCDRLPLLRRSGTSTVLVVQNPHLYAPIDPGWPWRQRAKLRVLSRWARHSAGYADLIVCSTPASARDVAASSGIDAAAIEVLPIPATGITRTKPSHAGEVGRVLLVGDVYPYKRLAEGAAGVTAFAKATGRPVTLVHLGTARDATAGDEFAVALERAAAAGVTVERRGKVPHDEVIAEMTRADVLLLPSLTETQGLPLVEAHAVGLPVVCRDIGPFRDLGVDAGARCDVDAGAPGIAEALRAVDPVDVRTDLARRGTALHPPADRWAILDLVAQLPRD